MLNKRGDRNRRIHFRAVALTPDALAAHPEGVTGTYAGTANMIRFGLRKAHPGQYEIRNYDTGEVYATAYVRVG
jgi:hypothetical protein